MPRPNAVPTTLRPDLQEGLEEFPVLAQQRGYVGLRLFPTLEVPSQAGQYGVLPLEQIKKNAIDLDVARAPNSGYTKIDWKFEMATYATQEYGIEVPVDAREAAMYGGYFDSELISAEMARLTLLDRLESRICALATNTTDYTGDLTAAVATAWTTYATATPVTDIFDASKAVFDKTGQRPNAICMNWTDFHHMRLTAQFQDMVKYTSNSMPGMTEMSDIAGWLGVKEILVAGVSLNSGVDEAAATLGLAWPVGKIWVGIKSDTPSPKVPCAGRTLHWGGDDSVDTGVVEEYWDESRRSTIQRVRHDVLSKLMYKECAHILTGAST